MNRTFVGQPTADDNEGYAVGADIDNTRSCNVSPATDFASPDINAGFPNQRFGSAHPGGLNVALADGSIRHVNYAVYATLWRSAGTVAEGEVLGSDW